MTNENKITNDNQYKGDKELEAKIRKQDDAASESIDELHQADTENRPIVDEADINSNADAEGRRIRADFSENPSKDK